MPVVEKTLKLQFRSARNAVIAALLRNERLSRSELSEITGVSPAAITEATQAFYAVIYLVELPALTKDRGRGRPTVQLQLQASHAYFLGISVEEWEMPLVLTDLRGRVLEHQVLPACRTPAELVNAARKTYSEMVAKVWDSRGAGFREQALLSRVL